jgi:hypothetical protein
MKNLPITKKALVLKYQLWVFSWPYFVTFLDEKFAIRKKALVLKCQVWVFFCPYFVTFLDEKFAITKKKPLF